MSDSDKNTASATCTGCGNQSSEGECCQSARSTANPPAAMSWECHRCNAVNAPWSSTCSNCLPSYVAPPVYPQYPSPPFYVPYYTTPDTGNFPPYGGTYIGDPIPGNTWTVCADGDGTSGDLTAITAITAISELDNVTFTATNTSYEGVFSGPTTCSYGGSC